MRYRSQPEARSAFFALWSGSPHTDREILVCVYDDEQRANQCAEVMGCTMRPVTADELQDYLVWRRTLESEAASPDSLVSFYLRETAPILPLSGVIAYIHSHP